jgi:hypothetical protein
VFDSYCLSPTNLIPGINVSDNAAGDLLLGQEMAGEIMLGILLVRVRKAELSNHRPVM